jgi:Tfp pilus assembly protein PilN
VLPRVLSFRALLSSVVALCLVSIAAIPVRSDVKPQQPKEKEIADLEKQIQQLTQRLNDLRQAKTAVPGTLPAQWVQ